jgi:hypothetical protein
MSSVISCAWNHLDYISYISYSKESLLLKWQHHWNVQKNDAGLPRYIISCKLSTANMQSDFETDLWSYFHLELIYLVICKEMEIHYLHVLCNKQTEILGIPVALLIFFADWLTLLFRFLLLIKQLLFFDCIHLSTWMLYIIALAISSNKYFVSLEELKLLTFCWILDCLWWEME